MKNQYYVAIGHIPADIHMTDGMTPDSMQSDVFSDVSLFDTEVDALSEAIKRGFKSSDIINIVLNHHYV